MKNVLWLVALWVLSACSIGTDKCTNVNQDSIFQEYSVTYDGDDDETSASATLKFGQFGTTLEMDGNCDVSHSSYALSPVSFLGISYGGSGAGFLADHTFTFTDSAGKSFVNSGTMREISFTNPGTVDRSDGVTLSWSGGGVGPNETVTLYLQGSDGKGATVAESKTQSTQGATSVTMAASDMDGIVDGPAEMYMIRALSAGLSEQTSNGGQFYLYYQSPRVAVTIQE